MNISNKQLKKYPWLTDYKKAIEEDEEEYDESFGHDVEFDFLKHFKKLSDMGAKLKIINYYSISIELPNKNKLWRDEAEADESIVNDMIIDSYKILLYILTTLPGPSYAKIVKTPEYHDELHLEWHF